MKQIFLCFLVISLFSCSKEKTNTIHGEWSFVEATGMFPIRTYPPGIINLNFYRNGELSISSTNSLTSSLHAFDRFELMPANRIMFYNSSTPGEKTIYNYTLNDELILSFEFSRCPHFEKFIRL